MSFPSTCCTLPPVESDYQPKGTKHTIGDLTYYVIGESQDKILFALYDIFGFHNNTIQFADLLASVGFKVIMPDFFRGKPWPLDNFPPKDRNELVQWGFVDNNYENRVSKDINNIIDHLKIDIKNTKLGIFGFCWGGKQSIEALKVTEPIFKSGALIHPAGLTEEDFHNTKRPILFAPTKEEESVIPLFDRLSPEILAKSEKHDFTDTFHGFAAARGNFKDENNKKRVNDIINLTAQFFKKTLA